MEMESWDRNDDWLDEVAEYLDFQSLYAFLATCRRRRAFASSSACWDGWRMAVLLQRLPGHVRWRPHEDPQLVGLTALQRASLTHEFTKGLLRYEDRDFAGAVDCLRAASRLSRPPPRQVMCRLADALYGKAVSERSAEADRSEDEVTSDVDSDPEGGAGRTREYQSLMAEAEQLYKAAIEIDPGDSYAWNGLSLFAKCQLDKRKFLEKAVDLDGENPYALANLGADLIDEDNVRALRCLTTALTVNPRLFFARLYKCQVLFQLGDLAAAEETAIEQLACRPHDETAHRMLNAIQVRRELMQVALARARLQRTAEGQDVFVRE